MSINITRRGFLETTALTSAAFAITGCMSVTAKVPEPKKPNIIFILADDLGYGDLGCYGQTQIKTPNIDQMSAEGMRFTQHYAGSTVCAPSRCSLLTGLHTGHSYMRGNAKNFGLREDPQDIILPRLLKNAGYHTAMIGKSGVAADSQDGAFPNRKGFDHFFGFTSHWDAHYFYPEYLWRNGKKVKYPGNTKHEGPAYSSTEVTKEALTYLDERSREKKPFFLHLAFQIPHVSLRAPEEYKKMYRGKFQEPEGLKISRHWSQEKEPMTTYAAMVSYMDHNVGLILRKLKDHGMDKNTLIVFSSDNGPEHTGGSNPSYFSSSGKLRGLKRDLYEGGIRVPFIARWPGCIEKGSVSKHISAFWDFLPTCCELASIEPPATDGISYLPSLLGKTQKAHDYLYWEFYERGGKTAIRKGQWKLILTNLKSKKPQIAELFDLEKDIAETNDLSKTRPDIVKELKSKMHSSRVDNERYKLRIE